MGKNECLPGMNKEWRPQSVDLVRFVGIAERKHAADFTHACNLHASQQSPLKADVDFKLPTENNVINNKYEMESMHEK